ncbi:nickel-binding protein [Nostoc sp.]|uniref:nickel-binding protein n=1 Tax=Nostoc sp. TaxID=1180 RepID=UPI002FFCCD31
MTYDRWMQVTQSLDGCIEARNIQWQYSLVSMQGDRSFCVYQVPYTDAVREAYREAGIPFQRIWQADMWLEQNPTNLPQSCSLAIAEVNYNLPITKAIYESRKHQAEGCFHELNVQHAFSAVSMDGTYSICVFSAATAEDVRSLYRKVGQPFERVWKATFIQPNTDTPAPAS